MAIKIEDDCVECGLPCIGSACRLRHVKHFYCDVCGEEFDPYELHEVDDKMLCNDCLIPYLEEAGIIGSVENNDD